MPDGRDPVPETYSYAVTKMEHRTTGYGENIRTVGVTVYAKTFDILDVHSDDELTLQIDLPWTKRASMAVGDVLTIAIDSIDSNGYHLRPIPEEKE